MGTLTMKVQTFALRHMSRYLVFLGSVIVLFMSTGCGSITPGIVLMDYDQTNNFRYYQFKNPLRIDQSTTENGIQGYLGNPFVLGFWLTYIICSIDNQAADAQPFSYDLSKFYVSYEGQKYYYKPLAPYTFSTLPNSMSSPAAADAANLQIRNEILISPDTAIFPKGTSGGTPLNHRFSIYVRKAPLNSPDSTGPSVDTSVVIPLRYEGAPNLLRSRNQPPEFNINLMTESQLATRCRPQIVVNPIR